MQWTDTQIGILSPRPSFFFFKATASGMVDGGLRELIHQVGILLLHPYLEDEWWKGISCAVDRWTQFSHVNQLDSFRSSSHEENPTRWGDSYVKELSGHSCPHRWYQGSVLFLFLHFRVILCHNRDVFRLKKMPNTTMCLASRKWSLRSSWSGESALQRKYTASEPMAKVTFSWLR